MWSVCGRIVVVQDPVAIPRFFRSFSANWFTQTSQDLSLTVNLPLLRIIVLTLATIFSFLNVDSRPERGSFSTEVLTSLNRRNQSITCVRPIAPSPYAFCNNWYVSVVVFPILKLNVMQMRCSVISHIVKIAMTKARVTSVTYYSQLSKRSHLQLVSWIAKACTNMSRLVANTSHPVNNNYISSPNTIWTNLVFSHTVGRVTKCNVCHPHCVNTFHKNKHEMWWWWSCTAETCSLLDYYNKVLCVDWLFYC